MSSSPQWWRKSKVARKYIALWAIEDACKLDRTVPWFATDIEDREHGNHRALIRMAVEKAVHQMAYRRVVLRSTLTAVVLSVWGTLLGWFAATTAAGPKSAWTTSNAEIATTLCVFLVVGVIAAIWLVKWPSRSGLWD